VLRTDRLLEQFGEALCYAHEVHCGQCREKTHAPYISQVLGVASREELRRTLRVFLEPTAVEGYHRTGNAEREKI